MAKVLVAVLDWGLGHASRSSRIIQILLDQKHEVIVASGGSALQFLKSAFPLLKNYELPAYNIRYSGHKALLVPSLAFRIPAIIRTIKNENSIIQKIIAEQSISLIISDNRYGCYSRQVYSVFLCHQLSVPLKGILRPLRSIVALIHARFLKKFDSVWVPDFSDRRFSGSMSVCNGLNSQFIGILSRFSNCLPDAGKKYFITAIISGPDPQRARLVAALEKILSGFDQPCLLLTGTPGTEKSSRQINHLTILSHAETKEMQEMICNSSYIIARSGYSSLMDFAATASRVLFIPTPGQPEQEYIAERMHRTAMAVCLSETDLTRRNIENLLTGLKPIRLNADLKFTETFLSGFPGLTNPR